MKESTLAKYFENDVSAEELAKDLQGSQVKTSHDVTSIYIERNEDKEFKISREHLINVCNDLLRGALSAMDVNTIATALEFSDYFDYPEQEEDSKIVGDVLFDWSNPEISFDLTTDNFLKWKKYLETGSSEFTTETLKKQNRGRKTKRR